MKKVLLAEQDRAAKLYPRGEFNQDVLYAFFQYRGFKVSFFGAGEVSDPLMERLLVAGTIKPEQAAAFGEKLKGIFTEFRALDPLSIHEIYKLIHDVEKELFGVEAIEADKLARLSAAPHTLPEGALWQDAKKEQLLKEKTALVFALCEPEWAAEFSADVKAALQNGADVYVVSAAEPGNSLLTEEALRGLLKEQAEQVAFVTAEEPCGDFIPTEVTGSDALEEAIAAGKAGLLYYGESGLLHCRGLRLDAVVYGVPTVFASRVMVNQLDRYDPCLVFVPAGFDMTKKVRLKERSRVCYWQLARLWEAYGDKIYGMTVSQLYVNYPQYFMNVYESGACCPEAAEDYPIRVRWPEDMAGASEDEVVGAYLSLREKAVGDFVNSQPGVEYVSGYFDTNFDRHPIPWGNSEMPEGIAVQGTVLPKAKNSRIMHDGDETLRNALKAEGVGKGLRYYTNFLFFMTENLIRQYNRQRADRPEEQLPVNRFHLDYMMERETPQGRVESFPLFRKACIALKEDGKFLFFRFALRGGKITAGGQTVSWQEADVNPDAPGAVAVYSPQLSAGEDEIETWEYCKPVGEGRVNLVFVREKLHCVRRGDVILPAVGVVVSLDEQTGSEFLQKAGLTPNDRGYCDLSGLEAAIELQGPADIPEEEWAQVRWSYGGGMSLIAGGKDVFVMGEEDAALEQLSYEGWMSPLSRQTQESQVHKLAKHPRTVVGITEAGDFFVLVFSGRAPISSGADYAEMCVIARKLLPNIRDMMNVDGGASSVMGVDVDGSFMEISYPSTTGGNCAGMARPIYTALRLEQ